MIARQPRSLAVLMRWHSPAHADYFRVRHATYAAQLAQEALKAATPLMRSAVCFFLFGVLVFSRGLLLRTSCHDAARLALEAFSSSHK